MKSKYKIIADIYREKIYAENRSDSWKLPSETALMNEFGVSRQTVRRAMTELIQSGLAESRQGSGVFVRNINRKRLKIAFITFSLDTYIFPEIIRGLSDELFIKNSDLILYHTDYSIRREEAILNLLEDIDGVVITPCYSFQGETNRDLLKEIDRSGTPVILLDNYFPDNQFTTVSVDDYKGGELAASLLYRKGHRNIIILHGEEHFGMQERKRGAAVFLKQKGLIPGKNIFEVSCSLKDLENQNNLYKTISGYKDATAVFCTNDQIAYKVIESAALQGIYVPEDLSIIGFDDSNLSRIARIPFTSITHPKTVTGEIAGQLILNRIKSPGNNVLISSRTSPVIAERGSIKDLFSIY